MHPKEREYHEQASTLIVTVESEEEFRRGVEEGIKALEQDRPDEVDGTPVVSFTNYEQLLRTITPETLALIETIRRTEPSSINETARVTGRDVKNIHEELTRLGNMGIIDLVEEGQSKRPVVWYDELDIKVPFAAQSNHAAAPS
jgi:predicted transcriptional regulator